MIHSYTTDMFGIKQMIGNMIFGRITRDAQVATIASHPQLVASYERMCHRNGIQHIPQLLISPSYPNVLAWPKEYQILVGEMYLSFLGEEHAPAILAHETAHILYGHTASTPANELLADRTAALLLGDAKPVIAMVKAMNDIPRMPHETALRDKLYGGADARFKNAATTDVNDPNLRASLVSQISQYNAARRIKHR